MLVLANTIFLNLWAKGTQRLDHKVNKTIPTKIRSVYNYLFALIYNLNLFSIVNEGFYVTWITLSSLFLGLRFYAMDTLKVTSNGDL